jgi:hypothetical protein
LWCGKRLDLPGSVGIRGADTYDGGRLRGGCSG